MSFLYRYIFRGIGILFLLGILTGLFLAIRSHRAAAPQAQPVQTHGAPSPATRRPQ